ncbi:hypothetical protein ASG31_00825 [Chryseobacterium sp. Leaf404]|uniref:hypothetical protein n=1 Tax=unclassified Chryseobacterium TaxID=2593645 RepID=UPI0006F6879B|nr:MULTISPECIES: hypothetical protein [unclassified Chryseobacterium]KQT22451.1 hypothetical protein ASG31_00825 [Chryseobacterium sp. Leaf404]
MKKIIFTITFSAVANFANAQISIGGKMDVEGTSTILDFNSSTANTSGIILPAVDNVNDALAANQSYNNGTFLLDKSAGNIRMFENNIWVNLSTAGNSSSITANTTLEATQDQGAIIGSDTSNAKGVLILESANKAMILPRIATPHTSVKSPYPGMMCYDTTSKSIALFDGTVWNYWK